MSGAIYNEIEPFAADWLEGLAERGHIAPGAVERRSITELRAADVAGPGQRHFFAGIGGWSYALRLAGVPDDLDVWTGSCPCQPFSQAGRRGGTADARHLWPIWFGLIRECRPAIVFGEQVAGPPGLAWLDGVVSDLEGSGYAVGASVLSAGGASAPHGRHRIYFVAHSDELAGRQGSALAERGAARIRAQAGQCRSLNDGGRGRVADGEGGGRGSRRDGIEGGRDALQPGGLRASGAVGDADGLAGGRHTGAIPRAQSSDESVRSGTDGSRPASALMDPWRDCRWIDCADGKRRPVPVEPALFPLANGVPNRVGLLRGSGNAIVPQVAAHFIQAALEAIGEQ